MASFQTTVTVVDPDTFDVSTAGSTVTATVAIGVASPYRSQTVGYVNAIGNLSAPRPSGFGKIEWTADGQPTNAEAHDTVVRVDEVL